MQIRGRAKDRHGRVWQGAVLRWDEAEDQDFRFWYEKLTPAQRVNTVDDCTRSVLKTRSINGPQRLRRVCRVMERKGCALMRVAQRKRKR